MTNVQLSLIDFRELYPLFCINLKDHEQDIFKNGCAITLEITKDNNFKTDGYAIILYQQDFEIIVKDSKMSYLLSK